MSGFASVIQEALASVGDVAGETVSYIRGDDTIEDLVAVPGTTTFGTTDSEGFSVGFVSSDWIFTAGELVINSLTITPRRGDLVKHYVGGQLVRTYEVLPDDGTGGKPYRYSDHSRTRIRVHTKEKPA